MKKEGHPNYQDILFVDTATGHKFVCGSTLQPKDKELFEGKEYPVYRVPISSASHPFFTGSQQFVDSEGRVDKFKKKYIRKAEEIKVIQDEKKSKLEAKTKTSKDKKVKKVLPKSEEKSSEE